VEEPEWYRKCIAAVAYAKLKYLTKLRTKDPEYPRWYCIPGAYNSFPGSQTCARVGKAYCHWSTRIWWPSEHIVMDCVLTCAMPLSYTSDNLKPILILNSCVVPINGFHCSWTWQTATCLHTWGRRREDDHGRVRLQGQRCGYGDVQHRWGRQDLSYK
jgi:hypothetical protein